MDGTRALVVSDKLDELRVCEDRVHACERRILAQEGRMAYVRLGSEAVRLLANLRLSRGLLMITCDRIRRDIVGLRPDLQERQNAVEQRSDN